jgi:hypothetical protein
MNMNMKLKTKMKMDKEKYHKLQKYFLPARAGQPGQNSRDRQLGHDSKNQDSRDRTAGTGQPGQDSQDRQLGWESRERRDRTVQL